MQRMQSREDVICADQLILLAQQKRFLQNTKVSVMLKMVASSFFGYRLIRFVNTTKRLINLVITDCYDSRHLVKKLIPKQDILVLAPATSSHVWSAVDSCNFTCHVFQNGYDPSSYEHIYRICLDVSSLKSLSLMYLSEKMKFSSYKIGELGLPRPLREELLANMIPSPDKRPEYQVSRCGVCAAKLPLIIDHNPYTYAYEHPNEYTTRQFVSTIEDYLSLTELLTNMLKSYVRH